MAKAAEPTDEQPITRAVLLVAQLPAVKQADRVEVREIRMRPGHSADLNVPIGPVLGVILAGSVNYQVDGETASVLRAGDAFFEPEGERIARFAAGDDGARFVAYFMLSPGQDPLVAWPRG